LEFVDEAAANRADLLLETKATRVLVQEGRAIGIEAIHKGSTIELRGDTVVVSAGALETPRILQNTGIPHAGTGLALDVFQGTYGYTQDIGMQREIILATYLEAHIEEKELFAAPYMYAPYTLARSTDSRAPARLSLPFEVKTLVRSQFFRTKHLIGMMTKIRDEMTGEVQNDGTVRKTLTARDHEKLEEAYQINKQILVAAGADPDTIFRGVYESGHPCCTAAMGRVVDENQETEIKGLFVSDASVFPSPLGMPPILTIVALSKRLARHLLS
jgi:choline dehydrogenase-like flavoprotein